MYRYIIKRLLMIIPVVLAVAIMVFTIMYFCPGDPVEVMLGTSATDLVKDQVREEMGFNDPYIAQLGRFLKQLFLKFDLGTSYITQKSVAGEIISRFPRTFLLALACIVLNVLIGIPLGVMAATHLNSWVDRVCMVLALVGSSLPNFWVALELVIIFALGLGILPAYGIGGIEFYILPVVAASLEGIAQQARYTRSGVLEVIRSDFVTTARAKGVPESVILYKHALPNALIPVIQNLGNMFARSIGGALVIENVFSIPGLGVYLSTGITNRDYPIVRGCVVMLSIVFCLIMLLVDLAFAYIDPRIKAQYEDQGKKKKAKQTARPIAEVGGEQI